jgi:hypothetical protein
MREVVGSIPTHSNGWRGAGSVGRARALHTYNIWAPYFLPPRGGARATALFPDKEVVWQKERVVENPG